MNGLVALLRATPMLLVLAASAAGQVDLRLEPSDQIALVGDHIMVELVADAPSDPAMISSVEAVLKWDPARLALVGATLGDFPPFVFGFLNDPDGINDDVTDGEALYTVLAPTSTPLGLIGDIVVARFEFEVLTSACVGFTASAGLYGGTRVHGVVPGETITGTLAPDVVLEVPGTWVDLGGAAPGTGGLVPHLEGDGILLECDPWTLTLTDALPNSTAFLIVGFDTINLPLKGGIIVPDLDIIRIMPSGLTGTKVLTGAWPPGVPGGLSLYIQYWIFDTGAFGNYSASNGISGTTP